MNVEMSIFCEKSEVSGQLGGIGKNSVATEEDAWNAESVAFAHAHSSHFSLPILSLVSLGV